MTAVVVGPGLVKAYGIVVLGPIQAEAVGAVEAFGLYSDCCSAVRCYSQLLRATMVVVGDLGAVVAGWATVASTAGIGEIDGPVFAAFINEFNLKYTTVDEEFSY